MNESGLQHGLKNLCDMVYLSLFLSRKSAIRNWQLKTWSKPWWQQPLEHGTTDGFQSKTRAQHMCFVHFLSTSNVNVWLDKVTQICPRMLACFWNPPSPALPPRRTCCKATCHSGSFFFLFWAQQVKEIFQNQSSHPFTCWIFKNSKQL